MNLRSRSIVKDPRHFVDTMNAILDAQSRQQKGIISPPFTLSSEAASLGRNVLDFPFGIHAMSEVVFTRVCLEKDVFRNFSPVFGTEYYLVVRERKKVRMNIRVKEGVDFLICQKRAAR